MLDTQCRHLLNYINNALSEPQSDVNKEIYNGCRSIIVQFYKKHLGEEPTKEERDDLICQLETFGESDLRYMVITIEIIIEVIKVYNFNDDDDLQAEYTYKRNTLLNRNVSIEDQESLENIFNL